MKISLPVGLFLVFLTLKLCGVITWSWWWIASPLWVTAIMIVGVFLFIAYIFLSVGSIKIVSKEKNEH